MKTNIVRVVFYIVLVGLSSGCAELKDTGKTIGHGTRDVTTAIGHASRDTVKSVGKNTKKVVTEIKNDIKE